MTSLRASSSDMRKGCSSPDCERTQEAGEDERPQRAVPPRPMQRPHQVRPLRIGCEEERRISRVAQTAQ